jgi:hypothetical protein
MSLTDESTNSRILVLMNVVSIVQVQILQRVIVDKTVYIDNKTV